jgi:hypothetical protein
MPKDLPSVEEEKQLREMVQEHKRLSEIAGFFGKSPASIKMKISRLKLVVVVRQIQHTTTSNKLPSVEEALKTLNYALEMLKTSGLDQSETLRLRSLIQGVKIYMEKFADYLDYRGLEIRLIELEGKYAALVKKAPTPPVA